MPRPHRDARRGHRRLSGVASTRALSGGGDAGLIFIIQGLATNLDGYTRGALGLNGPPELTNLWWVYGWVLVTLVCWTLKHSSLGRTMLAIRENELAACLGVKITRTRILSSRSAPSLHASRVAWGSSRHAGDADLLHIPAGIPARRHGGAGRQRQHHRGSARRGGADDRTEALYLVEEAVGLYGLSQMLLAVAVLGFSSFGRKASSEWPSPISLAGSGNCTAANRPVPGPNAIGRWIRKSMLSRG